jgi:uroporphyrinogen-III synthase
VPEPNTWHELLIATRDQPERRIAIQEYGKSNTHLIEALQKRGAEVTTVRIYQWDLPENREPLLEAVRRLAAGTVDVVLFTTSIQVPHLFRAAAELGLEREVAEALPRLVIASIGPTTTEALEEYGLNPDIVPSHPKMGFLVKETADQSSAILDAKQGR